MSSILFFRSMTTVWDFIFEKPALSPEKVALLNLTASTSSISNISSLNQISPISNGPSFRSNLITMLTNLQLSAIDTLLFVIIDFRTQSDKLTYPPHGII